MDKILKTLNSFKELQEQTYSTLIICATRVKTQTKDKFFKIDDKDARSTIEFDWTSKQDVLVETNGKLNDDGQYANFKTLMRYQHLRILSTKEDLNIIYN